MSVGRNDPCPCGSGKKYKRCCERLERTAGASAEVAGRVRSAALAAADWEADIVAFPGSLQGVPTARLGLLLVVADGFVVRAEPLEAPSAEPAAMADALAAALVAAARDLGDLPPKVLVRDAEVAAALTGGWRRLAPRAAPGAGRSSRRAPSLGSTRPLSGSSRIRPASRFVAFSRVPRPGPPGACPMSWWLSSSATPPPSTAQLPGRSWTTRTC